jgi:predicted nucleic acid-binding protein
MVRPGVVITDDVPIPPRVARFRLDPGEEEVLAWALEHPGAFVVIDDRVGRRAAQSLDLPLIGTLGIVVVARQLGMIASAREVNERLERETSWYMDAALIRAALDRLGE